MRLGDITLGQVVGVTEGAHTETTVTVAPFGIAALADDVTHATVKEVIGDSVGLVKKDLLVSGLYRAVVAAVGVPMEGKKLAHGVVLDLVWEVDAYRPCTCTHCGDRHPMVGDDGERIRDRHRHEERVTVHYSAVEPWEDHLAEALAFETEWHLRHENARHQVELRRLTEEGDG